MSKDCTSSPVRFPLMGEGVHEATVVKWLKKKGDLVQKDEPILEVSTDKVDTEISAPCDGFLVEIYAVEDSTIVVEQIIAYIASDANFKPPALENLDNTNKNSPNQDILQKHPKRKGIQQSQADTNSSHLDINHLISGSYAGITRSSPLVKRIAKEYNVNLNSIQGTGLYGRITKQDILAFIERGGQRHYKIEPSMNDHAAFKNAKLTTTKVDQKELLEGVSVRRVKMNKMRKLTAEHMVNSVRISPHVTTTFEINLHNVRLAREKLSKKYPKNQGYNFTYTSFFIQAAIEALKKHPEMNSSVDGDEILYKDEINIGCAVAIESGLIVPVIKSCNQMDIVEISRSLNNIVKRARNKQLHPEDVKGGTFSITNPGMYGSLHSQPIINQPQVGILSIGSIVDRPISFKDNVVVRPICQIGITFDHRIIDGEGGAKFLRDIKEFLEAYHH